MSRISKTVVGFLFLSSLLFSPGSKAAPEVARHDGLEKGGLPPSNTVGIRMTVSNVDPVLLAADLDLTMYTRGYGVYATTTGGAYIALAGDPFLGYPAIEFGDGATIYTTSLALTNSGGGPGGSNVYRSLASFSHTYPALGSYTARATMICVACGRSSYVYFPLGGPVPTAFTGTIDQRPTNVIGNLPRRFTYSGTGPTFFGTSSSAYVRTIYPNVTNTAQLFFDPLAVPTVSEWGLISLGLGLLAAGIVLMRRRRYA